MRALSIGPGAAEAIPAQGRRPVIIRKAPKKVFSLFQNCSLEAIFADN